MSGDILGEPGIYQQNGFTGVNLNSGATVVYKNLRRTPKNAPPPSPPLSSGPERDMGNVSQGAEPAVEQPAEVQNYQTDTAGATTTQVPNGADLRAILRVPDMYLSGKFGSQIFKDYGGILFPITPQITLENKAEYSSITPLHSNYPINFYKNSSVSDITITANVVVQNDDDAYYYLGMVRILTAITKMRFGSESMAGTPPPICRLSAYGEYVLKNVPVVLTSVKHDLPDDVDFYTSNVLAETNVSVPTKSTFTINMKPTYSRAEMLNATVDSYLNNSNAGKGYL
jgi:hypothetical protein